MNSVGSKITVAAFLARRPLYWPDLFRRLRINIASLLLPAPMGRSRAVAERWAREQEVPIGEALHRLGADSLVSLARTFPDVIETAERQREGWCQASMAGGGSIDLLYSLSESVEAKNVVETGVAYGYSSVAILLSISKRDGQLSSVDMPYPGRSSTYVGCVVPDNLRSSWNLYRYPDYVGLPRALKRMPEIDLCHYDSDKSYEGRAWAYRLLWQHLRPGGLMISDDISDNTAFRDFAAEYDVEPVIILAPGSGGAGSRYVGILVKP